MEFKELTEEQWSFIKPLLPSQPIVGRKRADDRKTINESRICRILTRNNYFPHPNYSAEPMK